MRMSTLAVTALLLAPAAAWGAAGAPAPADLDRMARDDTTLLAFLDGAPLSAEEQRSVRSYLERAYAANPAGLTAGAARVEQALGLLATHEPRGEEAVRDAYRPALEALPPDDAERRIVDAHDRTVAFDPASRLIVTEHTLGAVRDAMRWSAGALGKAPPDAAFTAAMRDALARGFAGMDHANKLAYAHAGSNAATALPALSRAPQADQRAALLRWGDADEPNHLMRDTVSALGYASAQASRGSGGSGDLSGRLMHSLAQRQMQQSIFTMGHPECGPMGGNPSSCGQAPIYTEIKP